MLILKVKKNKTQKTWQSAVLEKMNFLLPAPGVLSITGEWAELVVREGVVEVTVVGMVEHRLDALPEMKSSH